MSAFEVTVSKNGFSMKIWRGERMCLLGFDVASAEPDLVGFAIECCSPGETDFHPLLNRIAFSYAAPAGDVVDGTRKFSSLEAPFQKFRWVHFPHDPRPGSYTYRATKMHMPTDGVLTKGVSVTASLTLDEVTYAGVLDVGFTRNFASSQAFRDKFQSAPNINAVGSQIIPAKADQGLSFTKMSGDIYDWLGFEAYDLIFGFLRDAVNDPAVELDVFAYDLNEPDIVARLVQLGPRLRAVIDDSDKHGLAGSAESQAAAQLHTSAGAGRVKRTHFYSGGLQHHKVFIARRNGIPFKVLVGSTNLSFRGLYIQANNVLVFDDSGIAGLFGQVFDAAFSNPTAFKTNELALKWHPVLAGGTLPVQICFSPHPDEDLALHPVGGAIDQASSSVLYSVAFLNLVRSGHIRAALDRLITRPLFSYGTVDKAGSMQVRKPDGSVGLVDFAYLAKYAPEPFKTEWRGGTGVNVHHKFVVIDFGTPTAKVFTGSSNFSPSGEEDNGDHLIMIEDGKVATGYAIEAVRVFDHLHFRSRMSDAAKDKQAGTTTIAPLTLRKPKAISGKAAWFEAYYVPGSQRERDRRLFSS